MYNKTRLEILFQIQQINTLHILARKAYQAKKDTGKYQ